MQLAETISFWSAVVLYALGFAFFVVGMFFQKMTVTSRAVIFCSIGFAFHTTALGVRWIQTGYPPFVAFFESVAAAAWFGVLGYLILQTSKPAFRSSGVGVCGTVVLLLGWASTPSYAGGALSASLQSVWLFIHATFATSAVGCFLVAAGVSIQWLWKHNHHYSMGEEFNVPSSEMIDETAFRFIAVGFLFYTIMLLSGAVWANQAWGSYWNWDPIETWSLITWLLYAVYLHLHFTFKKLRGLFTVWYAIMAVIVAAFSLWGVGYVYKTIHTYG